MKSLLSLDYSGCLNGTPITVRQLEDVRKFYKIKKRSNPYIIKLSKYLYKNNYTEELNILKTNAIKMYLFDMDETISHARKKFLKIWLNY